MPIFSRFIRVTFHFHIFHSFVVELIVPIFSCLHTVYLKQPAFPPQKVKWLSSLQGGGTRNAFLVSVHHFVFFLDRDYLSPKTLSAPPQAPNNKIELILKCATVTPSDSLPVNTWKEISSGFTFWCQIHLKWKLFICFKGLAKWRITSKYYK